MSDDSENAGKLRKAVNEIEALLNPDTTLPDASAPQPATTQAEPNALAPSAWPAIKRFGRIVFFVATLGFAAFLLGSRYWRFFVTTCFAGLWAFGGWFYLFKTRELCDSIKQRARWFPTLAKMYSGPSAYFFYKISGIVLFAVAIVILILAIRVLLINNP